MTEPTLLKTKAGLFVKKVLNFGGQNSRISQETYFRAQIREFWSSWLKLLRTSRLWDIFINFKNVKKSKSLSFAWFFPDFPHEILIICSSNHYLLQSKSILFAHQIIRICWKTTKFPIPKRKFYALQQVRISRLKNCVVGIFERNSKKQQHFAKNLSKT